MASQRVRATREGYYNHERIKEGRVFSYDEKGMKKDAKGKPILPLWVESADKPAKTEVKPEVDPEKTEGAGQDVI